MPDRDTAPHENSRGHASAYDTCETPQGTPPVIRSGEGETDEDTYDDAREALEHDDAREALDKRQRERKDREGAGEEELDSMKPETLFPPD